MITYYEPLFLDEAMHFLEQLPRTDAEKILYTIRKAQVNMDAELFKKIDDELWEFRTYYRGFHYRLFAFIQHNAIPPPFVIITNGFIKRTRRLPLYEKDHARQLKKKYLSSNP